MTALRTAAAACFRNPLGWFDDRKHALSAWVWRPTDSASSGRRTASATSWLGFAAAVAASVEGAA
jgi:hypothetical protein